MKGYDKYMKGYKKRSGVNRVFSYMSDLLLVSVMSEKGMRSGEEMKRRLRKEAAFEFDHLIKT